MHRQKSAVLPQNNPLTLTDLLPLVDRLSEEDRDALLEQLAEMQNKLLVTPTHFLFGGSRPGRLTRMAPEQLGETLKAISLQVVRERL